MTTTPTTAEELCRVCSKPKWMHEERQFKHQFVAQAEPVALIARAEAPAASSHDRTGDAQGRVRMMPGGDPVLRMALIRKGVISPEDLTAVEDELRSAGVAGYDPESLGQSGGR